MFKNVSLPRVHGVSISTALAACVVILSGCGGSSSSGPLPTGASQRSAVISGVQGARRASGLLGSAGDAINRSVSTLTGGMALARRVISFAQQAKSEPTRQAPSLEFDETTGLYTRFTQSENGFALNFFEDAAGTKPAGSITFQMVDDTTVKMVFNVTKGQQPMLGTLTIHSNDADGTSGTLKGDLIDPANAEKTSFDLAFAQGATEDDTTVTGNFSVTDKGGIIAFKNITGDADGSLSADLNWNGMPGKLTGKADNSGSLSLGSGSNLVRADWNADGSGKITMADGSQVAVPDFDTATS